MHFPPDFLRSTPSKPELADALLYTHNTYGELHKNQAKPKDSLRSKYKCITISVSGGGIMLEPTLRITPKKYNSETTIVSMRMAKDLLKEIDQVASLTGRNRNEILTMSLEFALSHMEIIMNERSEK